MNVEQIKQALVGEWASIAPEIRPSASKNPDGTPKPFYQKREFKYLAGDRFELTVVNSADPNSSSPPTSSASFSASMRAHAPLWPSILNLAQRLSVSFRSRIMLAGDGYWQLATSSNGSVKSLLQLCASHSILVTVS